MPARRDWMAAAPDRPTDFATAFRRPNGAGWWLRRTHRPYDDLPLARRGWLAAAPDRLTRLGPPAGPTGPGDGCAGPNARVLPLARRWRLAAAPNRPTVLRPPAGPTGPGGGCAGPTDRAMASRRSNGAGWQLRLTDRATASRRPHRGQMAAALNLSTVR